MARFTGRSRFFILCAFGVSNLHRTEHGRRQSQIGYRNHQCSRLRFPQYLGARSFFPLLQYWQWPTLSATSRAAFVASHPDGGSPSSPHVALYPSGFPGRGIFYRLAERIPTVALMADDRLSRLTCLTCHRMKRECPRDLPTWHLCQRHRRLCEYPPTPNPAASSGFAPAVSEVPAEF